MPGVYTFKTGSLINCVNDSFQQIAHSMDSGYHLTTFKAIKETPGIGFCVNGKRVCVGKIKKPYSDTTKPFIKKVGQTYQFKTDFPLICGNSDIFQQVSSICKRGNYYTKFRAVRKGSAGFYCGSTLMTIGTVI